MKDPLDKILLLGDPRLYETSTLVKWEDLPGLLPSIENLFDLIVEFRRKYGAGRAIAAPQTGLMKRIICVNIDKPVAMINPVLSELSPGMFEVWDDCMCFPNLLVRVLRHQTCKLEFYDLGREKQSWYLEGDLSELIQHEYDHLNGILAIQRAVDDKSFRLKNNQKVNL